MPADGLIPDSWLTLVAAATIFAVMFDLGLGIVPGEFRWVLRQPALIARGLFAADPQRFANMSLEAAMSTNPCGVAGSGVSAAGSGSAAASSAGSVASSCEPQAARASASALAIVRRIFMGRVPLL